MFSVRFLHVLQILPPVIQRQVSSVNSASPIVSSFSCGMSWTYRLYRVWIMTDPCEAPAFVLIIADKLLLHFIFAVRLRKTSNIRLKMVTRKYNIVSLSLSPFCHRVSNAFWTSKVAITAAKPRFPTECCMGVNTLER